MVRPLYCLLTVVFPLAAAANATSTQSTVPNLAIKTRETFDVPKTRETIRADTMNILYIKGARQRREMIFQMSDGRTRQAGTTITQCDEQRTVILNDQAKTFAYSPIESVTQLRERLERTGQPVVEDPNGPALIITIDAVDTGERREIGSFVARRVKTTTTHERSWEAGSKNVRQQDGWFIDLPDANCGTTGHLTALVAFSSPRENVRIVHRGKAARGYPIEYTEHNLTDVPLALSTRLELIEISESPLDDALFTVPPQYQPALPLPGGGHDMSRPDTLTNRLRSYWEAVVGWVWPRRLF